MEKERPSAFWRRYTTEKRQGRAYEKTFLQSTVPKTDSVPGGVIAVQTFGDLPDRFHPHFHIL